MDQPSKKLLLAQLEHFVVVHFQLAENLPAKIKFWLDDIELPKPFLAVSLSSKKEWFIISDIRSIALTEQQYCFRVEDIVKSSDLLLQNSEPLKRLSAEDVTSFDERTQTKFFDLLFSKLNQHFDNIDPQVFYSLAMLFCQPQLAAFNLNQQQIWVRLKGITSFNQVLAHAGLHEITNGAIVFKYDIPVLFEQKNIHFYFPCKNEEPIDKPRYYFLSIKKVGVIPFFIDQIMQADLQQLSANLLQEEVVSKALTSFIQASLNKTTEIKPISNKSSNDFQGAVEKIENEKIWGWAVNKKQLTKATEVDIYIDRQKSMSVVANLSSDQTPLNYKVGPYGFSYNIDNLLLEAGERVIDICFAGTDQPLNGSPLKLGPGHFDCEYTITNGRQVTGWVEQRSKQSIEHTLQVLLDETICFHRALDKPVRHTFRCDLPRIIFDNKEHNVVVQIINHQQGIVFRSNKRVQHTYQGYVDKIDFNQVRGWIINQSFPQLPVELEIVINQRHRLKTVAHMSRQEVQQKKKLPNENIGFCEDLPIDWLDDGVCSVEIFIADTNCLVVQQKTILTPKDIIIRSLVSASEYLLSTTHGAATGRNNKQLSSSLKVYADATAWVRTQILGKAIQQIRQSKNIPKTLSLPLDKSVKVTQQTLSDTVDIIIPVYQGYEETLACIISVLSANNQTDCEIIVINDQSPDGRLTYKLQALAQENKFTLLQNEQNLGFVKTVNRGMKLHPDRNVVLLNADTRVCDFWLDRLVAAASMDQNIGTVTPFSNNATICSFPAFNRDNTLPKMVSLQELDQLFAQNNQSSTTDLPTAIGFCMLIKRLVLNDIGYFDEVSWQKGYGEENDFCLRASSLGWRHILAGDVFVQHTGAISFGTNKQDLLTTNMPVLNQRYPDYPATVQRFIQQDPVAPMRNRVIKQLLQKTSDQYMLFVLHNLGGGVKQHCDQLSKLLQQENCAVLELTIQNNVWKVQSPLLDGSMNYHMPSEQQGLVNDLKKLNVWRIHYHQTIGFPKTVWQIPSQLEVPYDFTAHDFTPMCPRINMIDETGGYCGESQFDADKCNRCIKLNGFDPGIGLETKFEDFGGSIQTWRATYKTLLEGADNIFTPSQNTLAIYQKHFNLSTLKVQPHPEQPFTIKAKTNGSQTNIIVAVIGAIGQHKGFDILLSCAKNALKEGLPLSFVVIGFTCNDKALQALDNVVITGPYQANEIDTILAKHHCSLAAFLSVWPETFCYTLTEAWQNNLLPVAFDIGAIADRIKETGFGKIIPFTQNPSEINQHLLEAASLQYQSVAYQGKVYTDLLENYYHLEKNELGH